MKALPISTLKLLDGREIPRYGHDVPEFPLHVYAPHRYAIVDMTTGTIETLNPNSYPDVTAWRIATDQDIRLIQKAVQLHKLNNRD